MKISKTHNSIDTDETNCMKRMTCMKRKRLTRNLHRNETKRREGLLAISNWLGSAARTAAWERCFDIHVLFER